MQNVLILGTSGMLGSMVLDYLSNRLDLNIAGTMRSQTFVNKFSKMYPSAKFRILNIDDFCSTDSQLYNLGKFDWIINCIGITKPYCKDDNPIEIENAILVNSLFPQILAQYAHITDAKIIQIASDCVYSGIIGNYNENSKHDALDVYGKTKSLGESYYSNLYNLRCSIIGPETEGKSFLISWLLSQNINSEVNGFDNHKWNGITTLHFAKLCYGIISKHPNLKRLQHIIPADIVTKFELLKTLAKYYNRKDININRTEADIIVDRTLTSMDKHNNDLLWKLAGYDTIPNIDMMVDELVNYKFNKM